MLAAPSSLIVAAAGADFSHSCSPILADLECFHKSPADFLQYGNRCTIDPAERSTSDHTQSEFMRMGAISRRGNMSVSPRDAQNGPKLSSTDPIDLQAARRAAQLVAAMPRSLSSASDALFRSLRDSQPFQRCRPLNLSPQLVIWPFNEGSPERGPPCWLLTPVFATQRGPRAQGQSHGRSLSAIRVRQRQRLSCPRFRILAWWCSCLLISTMNLFYLGSQPCERRRG